MKPKQLSGLEQEIMNIVWELESCSVRDVIDRLCHRKRLAYTTVATVFSRLYDKGLLVRKDNGMAYVYSPKLSKESYGKTVARLFVNKFFTNFGDIAVASFAKSMESLPDSKRKCLLMLLENYDKTK